MEHEQSAAVLSEDYFIGCLLKDYSFVVNLCETIGFRGGYLESPTAKAIWQGAETLFSRGISVDIASLVEHIDEEVKHINVASASSYMMKTLNLAVEHHNLTHHISVIKKKYRRRHAMCLFDEGICRLKDHGDVEDVSSWVKHSLSKMEQDLDHSSETKKDRRNRIADRYKSIRKRGTAGIMSRYNQLQQHLTSYQYGKMTILAARPKIGKSTFALNEVVFTSYSKNIPSLFFSIEMDYEELIEKAASDITEMDNKKLKLGEYTTDEVDEFMKTGVDEIMKAPIHVVDDPSITIERICSKTREMVAEHGVKFVVIDYIQIISSTPGSKFQSRNYEIGHMTNELRKLAKDTGCAIIVLSQISRPPKGFGQETNPRKMPMPTMNDLRDSGSIEQDAYAIIIIGPSQLPIPSPSWHFCDAMCIRVEGNRGGSTGDFECMFNKSNNKFMTHSEYETFRQNIYAPKAATTKSP